MEYISKFIITLVTTVILISAVEIIAPDNSMKKYIKFVLGLILITVMLNPIVYLFTKGENEMVSTLKEYEEMFTKGEENSEDNSFSNESQLAFSENLNRNCDTKLEEEFTNKEFESDIECTVDAETMTYTIDKVRVGVKDGAVKLIEKIKIKKDESTETLSEQDSIGEEDEIKSYLAELLGVSKDKIEIYKIEG